ncbi:Adenosylcobalamin-dependent ribonucleoside-triphosphate reductase [compost metagenome]
MTVDQFVRLMGRVEASGCGEPGVYWNNNKDWGTNPCCEIALEPYQMCNLTEINASLVRDQQDFNNVSGAASFIGTLQAGYTDFHYLNPKWRETCERGSLLGVSMTGIASRTVTELDMKEAASVAKKTNEEVSGAIGIGVADRITTVKPAGTTSLVLGCSSGIHAWHSDYYIRRMRAGKDEELAQYMMRVAPALVEQDVMVPHQVVLSFPQKAPDGACVRTESIFNLLERVKHVSQEWVDTGHSKGDNRHNVSCTISVRDNEWEELTNWMWINREHYNGISVLPYHGAEAYPQLPFSDCTKEEYEALLPHLESINIDEVFEKDGKAINLTAELACAGNFCELN